MEDESLKNKICCYLDDSHDRNWENLLDLLNEKRILNNVKSYELKMNYYGGGSPTMAMLDGIMERSPKSRLLELVKKLEKIKRNDVALDITTIMEGRTNVELLEDLTMKEKQCRKKLDGRDKSWEYLAEEYGFSLEEQKIFNLDTVRKNKWSPTEALLEKAVSAKPNFLLKDLEAFLREMERNDLANAVNEFIENHTQTQQQHQQIIAHPLSEQHKQPQEQKSPQQLQQPSLDQQQQIITHPLSQQHKQPQEQQFPQQLQQIITHPLSQQQNELDEQQQLQKLVTQQPQQQELLQVQQSSAEPIQSSDESLQYSCFCWKQSS